MFKIFDYPWTYSKAGFIPRLTKVRSRAVLGSTKPNWLIFSLIKFTENWHFWANNDFILHINFTSGTRSNFFVIGLLCFKSQLEWFLLDSCFDDADRSCKNQINTRSIVVRASLQNLLRNLLNFSAVVARNKPWIPWFDLTNSRKIRNTIKGLVSESYVTGWGS